MISVCGEVSAEAVGIFEGDIAVGACEGVMEISLRGPAVTLHCDQCQVYYSAATIL